MDPGNECLVKACTTDGKCVPDPVADGTAVMGQTAGDCKKVVCDGAGSTKDQPDDTDAPTQQTVGDCQAVVCDGAGATKMQADDADVPVDGNECTSDVCTAGVPSNPPVTLNTACGAGGMLYCDAAGQCVGCTDDTQCGMPTTCSTPVCNAGTCQTNFIPVGTATPNQTAGDCQEQQCDGIGGTKTVAAPTDINNDNNPCTNDSCNGSTPTHTNTPSGAMCTNGGTGQVCNGAGACVECLTGSQCMSGVCTAQACAAPTCTDTVKNGTETDVDCGGSCSGCANGKVCGVNNDCTSTVCSMNVCVASVCGDSRVTGTETCDDTGTAPGDGCSSTCQVEAGWECTGQPSMCHPSCGDGTADPGELCDDGNTLDLDGCSATCTVEPGFICTGTPSFCVSSCGNGAVDAGETCDDNNTLDGDGCSSVCATEPGYTCTGAPSVCRGPETACSDGIDDDMDGQTDGADSDCQLPAYFQACAANEDLFIFRSTHVPTPIPYYTNFFQSTVNVTGTSGGIVNKVAMMLNVTHPYVEDVGVLIEAPPGATQYLAFNARGGSGDNFTNTLFDSTCPNSITTVTSANAPFSACYAPEDSFSPFIGMVGDGAWSIYITDTFETSDDGTLNDWKLALCIGPAPVCGNGAIEFGEVCDDNNANNNDGCSSACTVEPNYNCSGAPSICVLSVCGNGVVENGEPCDDNNTTNGDGCSSTCTVEADSNCTGTMPSVCTKFETICNDNVDNDGDGNADAADTDCQVPAYTPACAMGQTLRIYKSKDTPLAIPDDDPVGINSIVKIVNNVGTIANGSLLFNVTHTYDADVSAVVTDPGGTTYDLTIGKGSSGDNFINTIFHPLCPAITTGTAPFSACFAPEGDLTPLIGTAAQGNWKLNVSDLAALDTGTLDNWAVILCTQ